METAHRIHGCFKGGADLRAVAGSCRGFRRRFITKAERREALETYRTQLQTESTRAEERLEKLGISVHRVMNEGRDRRPPLTGSDLDSDVHTVETRFSRR